MSLRYGGSDPYNPAERAICGGLIRAEICRNQSDRGVPEAAISWLMAMGGV
jgi:hypothetical protein